METTLVCEYQTTFRAELDAQLVGVALAQMAQVDPFEHLAGPTAGPDDRTDHR